MRPAFIIASGALLLFSFLFLPHPGRGEAGEVEGRVSLSGERLVRQGEVLRILPGAEVSVEGALSVKGKLLIEGEKESPVKIHLKNEKGYGMVIRGGTLEGRYFSISGLARGIESYSGSVKMSKGKLAFPGIHVNASGGTELVLEEIGFDGGKAGIVLRSGSTGKVTSCSFIGQKRVGVYVYGTKGVEIRNSLFSGTKAGIVFSLFGAGGKVQGNRFENNGEGIRVEKFAAPGILDNAFNRNRYGIFYTKRGMGSATGNVFDGNDVSVYLRYSSYPRFRGNDFHGFGRYAVMLENQSSEWEAAASDSDREEQFMQLPPTEAKKADRNLPGREQLSLPEGVLTGKIDFRGNFWGPLSGEMAEKGTGGNISGIYDGRDMAEFEYGERKYRMDIVDFGGHLLHPSAEVRR